MIRSPEEIGARMDALGLWDLLEPCNFAVKPKGTVFPYFCTVMKGERKPVKVRLLMLEGWQTLHDYVRTRLDRNFGFYSTPMEMPHLELVVLETGETRLFRHDTGYMPQEAKEPQRSLGARILWEVYGVMMRLESDRKLPLRFADEKAVFARVEGADGTWQDAPLVIPDPPPYAEKVSFPKADLKAAQDLPFVKEDVLELDFRMLPNVMTKEPRPRCVYGLKAVDLKTGEAVIDSRVSIHPEAGLRGMWESMPVQVLKELIRRGKVPGEIRLCSGRVFRLLRTLCLELPFKLSLHDALRTMCALLGAVLASCLATASAASLDGDAWRLDYRDEEAKGAWRSVPATVPGDTYLALQEAGVAPDLAKGTNVWSMFGYEQCEWRYSRKFDAPRLKAGERLQLRFDGVDTRATYYLNGKRLGASANMHVPVAFDVTEEAKSTDNELVVAIASPLGCGLLPVPGRTREGGTDVEGVRKAMHMFGWDIMPRLVTSGIWRSVWLDVLPPERFGDVHWMTFEADPTNRTARIRVDCQILAPRRHLHRAKLRLSMSRGGKTAWRKEHVVRFYQTVDKATLSDVDLWWPRGSGDPALYDAVAELVGEDGAVLARDARKFGLRTVRLERADWRSEEDPGTFRFIVNGEPVFMHGCDWSPLDALHSRDGSHLPRACEMLADLNCNMVRMWGGGVYEPDAFFDFCDANGILVWQDFAMGNVNPPQDDAFAAEIYREAKAQILRLRSHPSLAIWCANNEVDRAIGGSMRPFAPDPNAERVSREILPRVLREFDPIRPYLPSSPYWSPDVVAGKAKLSQDHIWCWKFGREREFTASTVTFVSEMGRHGCPNLESLERMMSPDGVYPWPNPKNPDHFNDEWNCKCTRAYPDYPEWSGDGRNAALVRGCRNYYGLVPTNLTDFVAASQFVQANELKTWIELYRSRKGRMWGVLWWNLRDGWPIISDGVVDWYFGKKRAYYAIRESQRPQLVCAVYDPQLKAVAVNDARHPVSGKAKIVDGATGRILLERDFEIAANGKTELGGLDVKGQGVLAIEYEISGQAFTNWFLYGEPPFDVKRIHDACSRFAVR